MIYRVKNCGKPVVVWEIYLMVWYTCALTQPSGSRWYPTSAWFHTDVMLRLPNARKSGCSWTPSKTWIKKKNGFQMISNDFNIPPSELPLLGYWQKTTVSAGCEVNTSWDSRTQSKHQEGQEEHHAGTYDLHRDAASNHVWVLNELKRYVIHPTLVAAVVATTFDHKNWHKHTHTHTRTHTRPEQDHWNDLLGTESHQREHNQISSPK